MPISILESDINSNIVSIMIEIRGIKTKQLLTIGEGEEITIRGPYWNGVFGISNVNRQKDKNALVLARGIGMAPMMPVIRKLALNNNKITLLMDKEPYKDIYIKEYLENYNVELIEVSLLDKGKLSDEAKVIVKKLIDEKDINYIHIAGANILTVTTIDYLNEIDKNKIDLSCCNNTKMCCGEGICALWTEVQQFNRKGQ